ncbi:very low-density lipoprotein receptor-like [Branchiostoma floridae]|uniref:Very low-density lipoprotein receptor-like n=1 Tax=Branchiostoma floridae TaxID=7739 RepID=A0A9J7LZQ1_BRAFL|nr:very low-density lipoprotein receptor-like [Branchiostoma floridae]
MRDSRPRGLILISSKEVCVPLEHQCNGFRDCSDGSDEEYCTDSCPLLVFNCKDSDVCIYFEYLCDTIFDCPDGSDENKCEKCEQYQCGGDAGSCFLDRDRCDGFVDCPDGLDEKNCTCPLGMLECKEGLPFPCIHDALLSQCGMRDCPKATNNTAINCISAYSHVPGWNFRKCFTNEFECETLSICVPLSRVCDGRNDCGDLSDETCADPKSNPKSDWACMLGWFECESNMCVPADSVCDGVDDCDDASDESRCGTLIV